MPQSIQISFRLDAELADKLAQWAKDEDLVLADFVRKLTKYAAQQYEKVGNLYELRGRPSTGKLWT